MSAGLKRELLNIAQDNDTRHDFAHILWECWRRLPYKSRVEVRSVAQYESDEEDFIDRLAELLR